MKNKLIMYLVAFSTVFALSFVQDDVATGTCDVTPLRNESKEALKPDFQYDASKLTHLVFSTKKQFKEMEIPLYIGEKYRFVFNVQALPQGVDIEVYDKKYESKDRKLLFSSKEVQPQNNQYVFEPQKAMRKVYLDYHVPASEGEEKKGCLLLTVGYRIKK